MGWARLVLKCTNISEVKLRFGHTKRDDIKSIHEFTSIRLRLGLLSYEL